nr:hypothetical protein [Tanacetum cinerariifolium]
MQYLPTTIWRRGDKDRAAAMIQAIDKMLKTRKIMRSLEKSVGRRLLCDSFDENNLFIFDDESVRISPVSKMPFRKKPRDSLNVRSERIRRALVMLEILSRRFLLKIKLSDHREHKREVEIPDSS